MDSFREDAIANMYGNSGTVHEPQFFVQWAAVVAGSASCLTNKQLLNVLVQYNSARAGPMSGGWSFTCMLQYLRIQLNIYATGTWSGKGSLCFFSLLYLDARYVS